MATVSGSAYELAQHRRLGRRAGLTPAEIDRVADGPAADWSARDRLLLTVTDTLLAERDLPDPLWAEVRAELSQPEAIELVMLVGHYAMLATTLTTLRVEPDLPR